jgi:Domain of unknown function (DUF6883)
LLIFDLRFDRFSIVLFRACAQVPIAKSTVDLWEQNVAKRRIWMEVLDRNADFIPRSSRRRETTLAGGGFSDPAPALGGAAVHHSRRIVAMKMPGGDAAIVDTRKLTGYCLNPEHPRGKHKARVFATLGFTAENADDLRAALLKAAASNDAQVAAADQFGDRYVLEFELEGPQGKGIVRSTWIVRRGERAPRLTSCFVK